MPHRQSPIDLSEAAEIARRAMSFDYGPSKLEFLDASRMVRTDRYPPNGVELGGEWYMLRQFHMHAPSEHTIEERRSAMEIHLVHENADGEPLVVGVLVEEGASNPAARELMRLLEGPRGKNVETGPDAFDPASLLPPQHASFRYEGSLTTPPFTEGVRWVVLEQPIEVSGFQRVQLTRRFALGARDLQGLEGRVIRRADG